jgi:hypothetical protein
MGPMTGHAIEAQHQHDLAGLRVLRQSQIDDAEDLSLLAFGRVVRGWQLVDRPFSPLRNVTMFWTPAPSFCALAHALLFLPDLECIIGARYENGQLQRVSRFSFWETF